ncbi:MAG: hypothetical protein KIT18_17020 [Burkholderiales bacterium]|nr:hypothetical protein [Burkholderiales bacterium]
MRGLTAVICFMLAASPLALAQEKGRVEAKKSTPAVEKKAERAKKGTPAEKKSEKAKREPTEAQKKQQERMRNCSGQARDKQLKGEERRKFMSECMKG